MTSPDRPPKNVCQRTGLHISECEEAELCGHCGGQDIWTTDRLGELYDGRDGSIEAEADDPWCH